MRLTIMRLGRFLRLGLALLALSTDACYGMRAPPPSKQPSPPPPRAPCGDGTCAAIESYLTCPRDCSHRVGIFYSGWHWPAYTALQALKAQGLPVMSVQQVLESRQEDGSAQGTGLHFAQLLRNANLESMASSFYYQHFPAGGAYCIVHQRQPGDLNYNAAHEGHYGSASAADCPDYAATVRRQAQQMVAAGIDFVVVDGTNVPDYNPYADALQLRPFEVLVQEFTALRAQGVITPEVAMWQRFPSSPVLANDPNDWSYRHVLAVYDTPAYADVIMHDVATGKRVYFYPDIGGFDPGFVQVINAHPHTLAVPMWAYGNTPEQWSFMSACQQGGDLDDTPCDQPSTATSVLGSQLAVVPTYQIGTASLPSQAPGLMEGLTLRKQFVKAFATQPNYLLLSSWNESIAQPGQGGPSMGLETDATAGNVSFVDSYGVEFTRDIEPSYELGSLVYDLVSSCLRVYRQQTPTCADPNEFCCQGGNFSTRFARFSGPQGAFVLFAPSVVPTAAQAPLYACSAGGSPFFSHAADCEGQQVVSLVGYVSTQRGGTTLRSLYRCTQGGLHAYALNAQCPSGMAVEGVLGYVH